MHYESSHPLTGSFVQTSIPIQKKKTRLKNALYIFLIFGLLGCKAKTESNKMSNQNIKIETSNPLIDSTPQPKSKTEPSITSLPFGPKIKSDTNICAIQSAFYYDLIGENIVKASPFWKLTKTYQLPPIKKYLYTVVDPHYDGNQCYRNISIDSLIEITTYKVRLPDYEGFEVYYASNDVEIENDFSEEFQDTCENFFHKQYGILLLYQKETKTARLLPIFYDHYSDAVNVRQFHIDEHYKILLCNKTFVEGDEEWSLGPLYEVNIKTNGEFVVKMLTEEK